MTNKEIDQLYRRHKNLIHPVAINAAVTFNYPDVEELCSVGTLAFLELLHSETYDPEKGSFSTYLYPQLQGSMFRYLELGIKICRETPLFRVIGSAVK